MSRAWFRRRSANRWSGYSVASWQGAVATLAFVAVSIAGLVTIADLANGSMAAPIVCAVWLALVVTAFFGIVRRFGGWHD